MLTTVIAVVLAANALLFAVLVVADVRRQRWQRRARRDVLHRADVLATVERIGREPVREPVRKLQKW